MNVEVFAMCDAANGADQKLSMLGAFDCIYAAQVPVSHARCDIVIRLRFNRIEEGVHEVRVNLVDLDGHLIVPSWHRKLAVQFGGDEESRASNLIIHAEKLPLKHFGAYSIELALDGRHTASLPFFVKELKKLE